MSVFLKRKSNRKNWRSKTCDSILNDRICTYGKINCNFSHNFLLCENNHKNSIDMEKCRVCELKLPEECTDMLNDSFCCNLHGAQELCDPKLKCSGNHGWVCYSCKENNPHNLELCKLCYFPRLNIDHN